MSELAVISELESLPIPQRNLVKLRVGQREVKDLNQIYLKAECLKLITRSFAYSTPNGQTDNKILEFQTGELFTLLSKYGKLTLPEIQEAFKRGLDGLYGPYFGMCGKTYNQFLKGFLDDPERSKGWMAYLTLIDKPKTVEIPQTVKIEKTKEYAVKRFEDYKKSGNIGFAAWACYDFIREIKGVKSLVSLEKFAEVKKKVEPPIIDMLVREKKKHELKGDLAKAEEITGVLMNLNDYPPFQYRMKEALLKVYFDSVSVLEL